PVVVASMPRETHMPIAEPAPAAAAAQLEPTPASTLPMPDRVEESLRTIARRIAEIGEKRILVTLAEGSDTDGRPLGAVALARALARNDARVVLVDFRHDGADAASMGEGPDLIGFSDLVE